MEVLLIAFYRTAAEAGGIAVLITLAARWLTVGLPIRALSSRFRLPPGSSKVLVWGGLRGGISVALALSLPVGEGGDTVLALTYCVVVFSILVQGLTIGRVIRVSVGPGRAGTGARKLH